jgi:hypothetical protein
MYRVELSTNKWVEVEGSGAAVDSVINDGDYKEVVVETFVGAYRADVSPAGVICIQDWVGKQTVVHLDNYSRMEVFNMEDEEIYATEGLGEWYKEQAAQAEAKAADAPEEPAH